MEGGGARGPWPSHGGGEEERGEGGEGGVSEAEGAACSSLEVQVTRVAQKLSEVGEAGRAQVTEGLGGLRENSHLTSGRGHLGATGGSWAGATEPNSHQQAAGPLPRL